MGFHHIIVQREQGLATVVLNRPEVLNALNRSMLAELTEASGQLCRDEGVRAIMLIGAGSAFCAGGDVKEMGGAGGDEWSPDSQRFWVWASCRIAEDFYLAEKPVIAALNGVAVGGGFTLALTADLIIASDQAKMGLLFVKRGLMPDFGALFLLPRMIGVTRAKELMFSGDLIDAEEGHRLGIVNRVVPHEQFPDFAREYGRRLASGATKAIGRMKVIANKGLETDLTSVLTYETFAQHLNFLSEDFREGIRAALERRDPRFKGK